MEDPINCSEVLRYLNHPITNNVKLIRKDDYSIYYGTLALDISYIETGKNKK